MQNDTQAITNLTRSMVRALKIQHGINVPHAALRAVLLQAQGLNPHAFAAAQPKPLPEDVKELQALVNQAPMFFHPGYDFDGEKLQWLVKAGLAEPEVEEAEPVLPTKTFHLAGDELGCLNRISLDAEGNLLLPEEFKFSKKARWSSVDAKLPRIRVYGFPDYISETSEFLHQRFGLLPDSQRKVKYIDLGDDSGDSCSLEIVISDYEWVKLVKLALDASKPAADDIAEWLGLHYAKDFFAISDASRAHWTTRYLESLRLAAELDEESTISA